MKSFSKPEADRIAAVSGLIKSSAVVCAWCHPPGPGDAIGGVSHGICPRHFKELVLAFQNLAAPKYAGLAAARREAAQRAGSLD